MHLRAIAIINIIQDERLKAIPSHIKVALMMDDNEFDDAYKPDIFAKSNFTEDEQKRIIATSLGICVGIGLTDLIVQIIKRSSKKRRERLISYEDITILPISEDPDAQEIPLPETDSDSSEASEVIEIIDAIEEIEE